MPRISVIIPSYNAAKWIEQTIESALSQTYTDFELIIVDDGSTDRTVEIANNIKDPRLRVYAYPNAGVKGPAAGRNRGLGHAKGEYVAFLDHDDLWHPQKLGAQLTALEEHPEAGLVYSWVDAIDADGRKKGPVSRTTVSGSAFDELLNGCFPWTGSNPFIRRRVLQEVGLFCEEVGLADDWDMWLRIAESYSFACVPQPHVFWRTSETNTSMDAAFLANSSLTVLNRAFARNPQLSSEQRSEALVTLYEGVIGHSVRGNPSRANCHVTIDSAIAAMRERPRFLFEVWRKPWLLRAILKALTVLVMGEKAGQAIFDQARSATQP